MTLLSIQNLSVNFGKTSVVKNVSFTLEKGRTLALVGESGSGKSVTALSLLQLLPYPYASHPSGGIKLDGVELVGAPAKLLQSVRGGRIGMIFQEPMTALNPLHRIGRQIGESLWLHKQLKSDAARARTLELLRLVQLPDVEQKINAYPHELSGGQRQRVMIAMALAGEPELLIADEPTTALDVTVQAQILDLLRALQQRLGMALLLITHDLGIVKRMADTVAVMRHGEIVESGAAADIFARPQHDYTKLLLDSAPSGMATPVTTDAPALLQADDLKVHFPIKVGVLRRTSGHIKAVDGITLNIRQGETLGIVGESGSGKTTLANAILRLTDSQGAISFNGKQLDQLSGSKLRKAREDLQAVFQDPFSALSPRMPARDIVLEGLRWHSSTLGQKIGKAEQQQKLEQIFKDVGLDIATADRYPHEFSGGQRQRLAIARALILKPKLVVLDEPTSALDRSVQKQVLSLLKDLQAKHGLSYLLITHDLAVVRAMAHRVLVMKDGREVESGSVQAIFNAPRSDYTKALLAASFD